MSMRATESLVSRWSSSFRQFARSQLLRLDANIPPPHRAALNLKRDVPGLGERMFRDVRNLRSIQIGPHLAVLRNDLYRIPLPRRLAHACPRRVVVGQRRLRLSLIHISEPT